VDGDKSRVLISGAFFVSCTAAGAGVVGVAVGVDVACGCIAVGVGVACGCVSEEDSGSAIVVVTGVEVGCMVGSSFFLIPKKLFRPICGLG